MVARFQESVNGEIPITFIHDVDKIWPIGDGITDNSEKDVQQRQHDEVDGGSGKDAKRGTKGWGIKVHVGRRRGRLRGRGNSRSSF